MKVKSIIKKVTALALTAALALGLAPTFGGIVIASRAESGTVEPSAQVYADRNKLMGDTFDPGSDEKMVGKLKFGKVGAKAIEWYILGADDNIEGEKYNIAIFAADNIITLRFNDKNSLSYSGDDDDKQYVGVSKREIGDSLFPDHYGESYVRAELRKMSGDEGTDAYKYFSAAEKSMMQKTKVLTHEYFNDYVPEEVARFYTTNDRLYLASGEKYKDVIYVGNKGESVEPQAEYTGKTLPNKTYWNTGKNFWLRSPAPDNVGYYVLYASIGASGIDINGMGYNDDTTSVRPASNLNLTDVLFASSADATTANESGAVKENINKGSTDTVPKTAMTLRLDGDSDAAETALGGTIGTVKLAGEKIVVTKGTAEKEVTLIIQGKDGDNDWYYAKTITADNAGEPVAASNITGHTSTDLSKCKIWLEAEDGENNIIYAVNATESSHEHKWSDKLTPYDDKQHGYACIYEDCPDKGTAAGFNELTDHTYNDDNVCTKCGYRKDDHVVTYVKEQPATSTAVGYKEHFVCSHCEEWFIYPATLGTLISQPKSYFEIPATGGSTNRGTTYSDGSTRNSDRYSSVSSGASQNSLGSLSSSGLTARSNSASGWSQDTSGRWWYTDAARGRLYGWILDNTDGKWYYVDTIKGRLYGWFYYTEDGYWYYLDANTGAMLTGWQLIGGKQYYFAPAPAAATYTYDAASAKWVYSNAANYRPFGSMYANTTTPDNHSVDADGVKIQ